MSECKPAVMVSVPLEEFDVLRSKAKLWDEKVETEARDYSDVKEQAFRVTVNYFRKVMNQKDCSWDCPNELIYTDIEVSDIVAKLRKKEPGRFRKWLAKVWEDLNSHKFR